ncbi:hypothetical protein [Microbispora sp. NPDC046933]|uniref:hypothetical protein n=1 Tax=Microbispora sp. NPDC046933 TaxID=3155618 RepID=UPI0033FB8DE5
MRFELSVQRPYPDFDPGHASSVHLPLGQDAQVAEAKPTHRVVRKSDSRAAASEEFAQKELAPLHCVQYPRRLTPDDQVEERMKLLCSIPSVVPVPELCDVVAGLDSR